MIAGLTAAEAQALARAHVCGACGGNLVDSWGGSFGVNGPIVRCLQDNGHSTYQKRSTSRYLINGRTNEWEEFNVQSQELVKRDGAIEIAPPREEAGLSVRTLQHTATQLKLLEQFVSEQLREGEDFGKVPGVIRPFLWKPGAENLASLFGCRAVFEQTERHIDPASGFVIFQHRCQWIHHNSGQVVLEGMGSCNSYEVKYRYREMKRTCPKCSAATIRKGSEQYGGGWYCNARDGGCGVNFKGQDAVALDAQRVGREQNPDLLDGINTYMKMSMKRAEVDCAMRAPGVARYFSIDHSEDDRGAAESQEETAPVRTSRGQRPRQPAQAARTASAATPMGATPAQTAAAPSSPGQSAGGTPPDAAPADLPPAQAADLAVLQADVVVAGLTWENFQRDVLKNVWAEWVRLRGTVAGAQTRLKAYVAKQGGG